MVKVYDGYNSLRKRLFRTITVSKMSTKDQLLAVAMKAFVVSQVGANMLQKKNLGPLEYEDIGYCH